MPVIMVMAKKGIYFLLAGCYLLQDALCNVTLLCLL